MRRRPVIYIRKHRTYVFILQKKSKFEVKNESVKYGNLKSFENAQYLTKNYFAFNKIMYYCNAKKILFE
jgi:hypothetical protein